MSINNIEIIETPQELFDSFNNFILSNDTKIFNKIEINLGIQQRVNMVNIKSNQMNALMLQK